MIKNLVKIFLITLFCTVTASPIKNEDPEVVNHSNEIEVDGHKEEYRLPHDTEPRLYVLEFDPDFEGEKFTFKGNGTISFTVLQLTTSVTLHRSKKIVIDPDSVAIADENGISHHPIKQKWNSENDFYTIKFEKKLEPGNYTLKINWASDDNESDWFSTDSGFFRVHELFLNENSSYMIATLFQPVSARTAFPCWDEPGFKAQFEISVKHFPNYTALSNMPEKSRQELDDGRIMTNFERSVKMSSYNPCIIVANCKSIKSTERNISFYGFNNLEYLEFPLKISESAVKVLEDYTDMPYALPKLDHLTIPQPDMPAMENWGLITYPTMSVLFKNSTLVTDIDQQDNVAFLVAHEVSHQWFGNLVTSAWWDDLWLSEAFATFFPHKIIDQLEGGKRAIDTFTIQNINEAMDHKHPSHRASPVKVEPKDKHGIIQMFGSATYYKGAGILQMLENVIGEDVFRDGIRRYLKAHQFGTVTSDDLWAAFQEAYDEANKEKSLNIKEFMDPWILQKGNPVLTVTRNYETGETNITQTNSLDKDSDVRWTIPINYATKSNPDFSSTLPTLWMNKNETTITLPAIDKDDWIILNVQQRAMYRVNYDEENWNRLADLLIKDHEKIHPVNRGQLIATAIRHIERDPSFIDTLFKISLYLHREKEFLPWVSLNEILPKITEGFLNTNYEDLFEEYLRFLTSAMAEINFDEETLESARIRKTFGPILCHVKNSNCLSYAQKLFDKFLENPFKNAFPEHDWDWVICTGLKDANDTVWEKLTSDEAPIKKFGRKLNYKLIKCTNDNEKRDKYLMKIIQLNSTSKPYYVNRVLQDFLKSNLKDVNYIMQFFCDHFEDFEKYYTKNDGDYFATVIERMFSKIQNKEQLDRMKSFVATHKDKLNEIISDNFPPVEHLLKKAEKTIPEFKSFISQFKELTDKYFEKEADGKLKLKNL